MKEMRWPLLPIAMVLSCSSTSVRTVEPESPEPAGAIALEVYTNGRDADQPPGSLVVEGEIVEWVYVAVNSGTVELTEVMVSDDVWGAISCSKTALNPGEQLLCSLSAVPEAGLFESVGIVAATTPEGEQVTASDPSHVFVEAVRTLGAGDVAPAVCASALVLANPVRDSVLKVELDSRDATVIAVGKEPIDIVIDDACAVAVTLNHRGSSVSVIDVEAETMLELAVRPGRNRVALSPDGNWAVVWADSKRVGLGCVGAGACPLGEVSVVDIAGGEVTSFAAGVTPLDVLFSPDSGRAILSADVQVGIIELVSDAVALNRAPIGDGTTGEAVVDPDGGYLWLRKSDQGVLTLLDLETFTVDLFPSGVVSDLELSADGSELFAVSAEAGEVRVYDSTDPFAPPLMIALPPSVPVTSVRMAPSAEVGLLFAEGPTTDEVVVWRREPEVLDISRLAKPVRSVSITADSANALVVHALADVDGESDVFSDQYVVSLVDLDSAVLVANTITVASRPSSWDVSAAGHFGVLASSNSEDIVSIDFPTNLTDVITAPLIARFAGFFPHAGAPEDVVSWVSHDAAVSLISPADNAVETVSAP